MRFGLSLVDQVEMNTKAIRMNVVQNNDEQSLLGAGDVSP